VFWRRYIPHGSLFVFVSFFSIGERESGDRLCICLTREDVLAYSVYFDNLGGLITERIEKKGGGSDVSAVKSDNESMNTYISR